MPVIDPIEYPWRTSRKNAQVIHVQVGESPSQDKDPIIGMMNSARLAKEVVSAHNEKLESK